MIIIHQLTEEQLSEIIKKNVREIFVEKGNQASPEVSEENDILDVSQAANFLSLKKATIYTLVSQGRLPNMKRSKRIYFSKRELIDYLKKGRRKTNDEINTEADLYLEKKSRV